MSADGEIRRAGPADAAAIAALTEAAYAKYVPVIGRRPMPMQYDYASLVAAESVWVVDGGDGLDAVLHLAEKPDHLLIDSVAVRPDRQGRGLGRRLMAFAETEARRLGCVELRLYTNVKMTANIALYRRLGYSETERRDEAGFARVFMAKRLGAT